MAKVLLLSPLVAKQQVNQQIESQDDEEEIAEYFAKSRRWAYMVFTGWLMVVGAFITAVGAFMFVMNTVWIQQFPGTHSSVLTFFKLFGLSP